LRNDSQLPNIHFGSAAANTLTTLVPSCLFGLRGRDPGATETKGDGSLIAFVFLLVRFDAPVVDLQLT
jgi:hypothetical protein